MQTSKMNRYTISKQGKKSNRKVERVQVRISFLPKFRFVLAAGLLLLQLCVGVGSVHAQCFYGGGFSEEDTALVVRQMMELEQYTEAIKEAECYLKEHSAGQFSEEFRFTQAEALRHETEFSKGNPRPALKRYSDFLATNPKQRKFREPALLHQGELHLKLNEFTAAKRSLRQLLKDYPDTTSANRAHFGLGRAAFYLGGQIQKAQGADKARTWYAEASQELETTTQFQLSPEELQERHWMLGWAWWFQNRPEQAEAPWGQYRKGFQAKGEVAAERRPDELVYRLAVGFQRNKALDKAEQYHALLVEEHPDSAHYAESAFVRAELAYRRVVSAQQGQPVSEKQASSLVAHYRTYLATKAPAHQGTSHFRIGTLEQQAGRRTAAVQAYRDYLDSGDSEQIAEVRFRLGTLQLQLEQHPTAIQEFQQYLKTEDTSHRPKALYLLGTLHEAEGQEIPAERAYQQYLETKDSAHADEVHFRLARLYQKRPDPPSAERHFAAIVEQHPKSPHRARAAFWRAESHYTVLISGKQTPSKKALRFSARHYQTYLTLRDSEFRGLAHYRRGMLFQQAGERKTAIAELNAYLKTPKPEHAADANYRLGLLHEQSEQPKSAIRAYRAYLKTGAAEHVPEVRFRLGMLHVQVGALKTAVKELNAYLATGDTIYEAESRFRLGLLHMELEQPSEAIREFNAYLKTGDTTYEAESRFRLGTLHMQSAEYPDAIREFRAYLQTKDAAYRGEAFYLLGGAHEVNGQAEAAERTYLDYLKTGDSAHADEVHFRLAVHYHQQADHAAAEPHFAAVVEQHPKSPHRVDAAWGRAENRYAALTAQAQEPQPADLRATAERYQDYLDTKDQQHAGLAHYRRGVLLQQAEDRKQAAQELEAALQTPNAEYAADAHYRLGWLYVQQEQPKRAIVAFQNYLKTGDATHVSEVRFQLGMLHLQTDDLPLAETELENYLETDDRTYAAEAHFRLGLLYAQDGERNFEAISELKKARAADAEYRDHPEVTQALVTLCEQSCNAKDRKALLAEVKDNPKLSTELREGYLVRLTQLRTDSGECGDIQQELKGLPADAAQAVRAKLQFAHGVCRYKAREWAATRAALLDIRNLPEYRAEVYPLRRDSHHELQDWKAVAEEVAHAHDTHPDILASGDYVLWVEVRRRVEDWTGADQAYTTWRTRFPEEFKSSGRLLEWVAVREQLPETEPRVALYRELLALDLEAETRTYVHSRWIETAEGLPVKERVAHFRELLSLDLNAETRAYVHSRWTETADGLSDPEERIGHYRELLTLPLEAETRIYVYSRWIESANELPVKGRVEHFRELLALDLNSETRGHVYSRWTETADGLSAPEERIAHYRELLAYPLDSATRTTLHHRWMDALLQLKPPESRQQQFTDLLAVKLTAETRSAMIHRKAEFEVAQVNPAAFPELLELADNPEDRKQVAAFWVEALEKLKNSEQQTEGYGRLAENPLVVREPELAPTREYALARLAELRAESGALGRFPALLAETKDPQTRRYIAETWLSKVESHEDAELRQHEYRKMLDQSGPDFRELRSTALLGLAAHHAEKAEPEAFPELLKKAENRNQRKAVAQRWLQATEQSPDPEVRHREYTLMSQQSGREYRPIRAKALQGLIVLNAERGEHAAFPVLLEQAETRAERKAVLENWRAALEKEPDATKRAKGYRQLLPHLQTTAQREPVVSWLDSHYRQNAQHQDLMQLWEQELPRYRKRPEQARLITFGLGQYCLEHLPQDGCGQRWLLETDDGGVSDVELEARLLLSQTEQSAGRIPEATQTLQPVVQRPLPSSWKMHLHLQLANLYQQQQAWEQAEPHYTVVVSQPPTRRPPFPVARQQALVKLQEIRRYLSGQALQQLIAEEKWPQVEELIRQRLASGAQTLDEETFKILLHAKQQQEDWPGVTALIYSEVHSGRQKLTKPLAEALLHAERQKSGKARWGGVLEAYALLEKHGSKHAATVPALVEQAQAAEKLGGRKRAQGYYARALAAAPPGKIKLRLQLIGELDRLYKREKNYGELLLLYEQGYTSLKDDKKRGPQRRQFAREAANMAERLKKPELWLEWLGRVDEGGRSDLELEAVYLQVQHFREIGHLKTASTRLYRVLKRNLPLSSRWFTIFNFERAEVLQIRAGNTNELQFWKNSLKRYKLVLKGKKLKVTENLRKTSRKRAKEIEAYLKALQASEG